MKGNNLVMYFSYLDFHFFYIKNKWRLHTTYPKREVLLKALNISLFLESIFRSLTPSMAEVLFNI